MKKFLLLFFGLLFFQLSHSQGFTVKKAEVDVFINAKGYFDVVEKYDIFFSEQKRGIFRNILTEYNLTNASGEHEKRKIKISKIKVPGHKFSADPSFVQKLSKELEIKIGDKNKFISGDQHYEIRYRVQNAFLFEENETQFYWNIKTGGWVAPFEEINFTIHPPEGIEARPDNFFVYSGRMGGTEESEEFDIRFSDGEVSGFSKEGFHSGSGDNVTVLLKMPAGAVKEIKPLWPFWSNYGWTFFVAAMLGGFFYIWNRFGKDDKVVATISYFPPKDVDPAMAGFLIDDKADTHDLTAFIPHWGTKGLIRVEHIPKKGLFSKEDTRLIKTGELPEGVPLYEREIFGALFSLGDSILISSLKDRFYMTMTSAKKKLESSAQIYYDPQARKMRNWTMAGIVILGLGFAGLFLITWGLWAALSMIPVAGLLFMLSPYLVKKNSKGNVVLSDLKGFKQFIRVAEEGKLKMLLEEDPNYFENTMAYALAFGLFGQWAKKFAALDIPPPNWYSSTAGVMSMNSFTNSFSKSIQSAQSNMVSSPSSSSSSGGGSSGGGFGGGGGGSW